MPTIRPGASDEPWRACYEQLAPRLLLFARQWLASVADAEDVVQTAFVRFWRKYSGAQPEHYPLLYAAVRSAALDLIRRDDRRAQREGHFQTAAETAAPLFDPAMSARDEAELIQAALERLPAEQRETLVLRIWGELSFAEIAEALGESINTVAARHRYALNALRRILKPAENERIRI
jgi:RNA polymerase sigma-70 factor (ECF subfamily)